MWLINLMVQYEPMPGMSSARNWAHVAFYRFSARVLRARNTAPLPPGGVGRGVLTEIHVDLHADRERAGFRHVDQHFDDVDIRHIALSARVAPLLDQRC